MPVDFNFRELNPFWELLDVLGEILCSHLCSWEEVSKLDKRGR